MLEKNASEKVSERKKKAPVLFKIAVCKSSCDTSNSVTKFQTSHFNPKIISKVNTNNAMNSFTIQLSL